MTEEEGRGKASSRQRDEHTAGKGWATLVQRRAAVGKLAAQRETFDILALGCQGSHLE